MINEAFINPSVLHKIRQQLIPNFQNMGTQSQNQVNSTLTKIINNGKNKQQLSQISRKNSFDQTPLLRSHLWKLLLGVLDGDWTKWDITRKKNSQLYKSLRDKFFTSYVDEDDLLDFGTKNFDQDLWNQIVLDTKRTHTALNFFQAPVKFGKVFASKVTRHCDMLTRILYIWGKTNSTVRYVQGMNEILAPFYYLQFQNLQTLDWDRESQVFFLFSAMMSFIIDMHIKQMDDCQCGIMGRMKSLNKYLRIVDGQLWQKMQKQGIYPQFYSFRWLALFLAQQFQLFQTIRLWDFVFSYDGYSRFFFVDSLCVSILLTRKKSIIQNDFTTSLPLIQKLKDIKIQDLIRLATKLFNKYKNTNINQKFQQLVANNLKDQQLIKKQSKQIQNIQQKTWSYAELLKNTGNYLGKWKNWASKDANK